MSSLTPEQIAAIKGMSGAGLEKRIATGGNKYLVKGTHAVTLDSVDTNQVASNRITFKYVNDAGQEHNDRLFLFDVDKKTGAQTFNWKVEKTLGMLIPSVECFDALLGELVTAGPEVFHSLAGCAGKLVLEDELAKKGYTQPEQKPGGGFLVRNVNDKDDVYEGDTADDAKKAAEQMGLKAAGPFPRAVRYQITDAAANIKKFTDNLAASKKVGNVEVPF